MKAIGTFLDTKMKTLRAQIGLGEKKDKVWSQVNMIQIDGFWDQGCSLIREIIR